MIVLIILTTRAYADDPMTVPLDKPWSKRIALSFLLRHPHATTYDSGSGQAKWNYEQGLMLEALRQMWFHSTDSDYYWFIKDNIDQYVHEDGTIRTYKKADYNLDNISGGRALLFLFKTTHDDKYKRGAALLMDQLKDQPRTKSGGFWHKKVYPFQMWLDGLFMAQPFTAEFASLFHEEELFDNIALQFILMANSSRDPRTGLLYHGWDERREERWANRENGCSSSFWGRAIGWYAMGLVDILDYFPPQHPKRQELLTILNSLAEALIKFKDSSSSLWYQVVDQGGREGNYLESSASAMFAYVFAKGANRGYLGKEYSEEAEHVFRGVLQHFVTVDGHGFIDLHQTCKSAGLGGKPYRDGSFGYYVSEVRQTNDLKGIGPLLLAAIEIEEGKKLRTREK